jgi:hypothetical protein
MEHYRDLPMAAHDSAVMSSPSLLGTFETSVRLERELESLLHERIEQHQQMLVESVARAATTEEAK